MGRFTEVIVLLSLVPISAKGEQIQSQPSLEYEKEYNGPTIIPRGIEATNKVLVARYDIRNDGTQDIWVLAGMDKFDVSADALVDQDGQTLVLRSRFGVAQLGYGNQIYGRYVRLRPGVTQSESVCLHMPVHLTEGTFRAEHGKGPLYLSRLAVELGYYRGDLPDMIWSALDKTERPAGGGTDTDAYHIARWFGGSLGFNALNEGLRQRDEEVVVPYTDQALKGEQVLQMTLDGLHIACEKEESSRQCPPDLTKCKQLDIQYQPSMLEYFFPYAGQQSLLSPEETEYLRLGRTIVVNDAEALKALSRNVSKGAYINGIVRKRSEARLTCHPDGEPLISLPVYNDESIVTEVGQRFVYFEGFRGLGALTPRVRELELRSQCAVHFKDIWYRLRLYGKAAKVRSQDPSATRKITYPRSNKWCDALAQAYRHIEMASDNIWGPYKCPSARDAKCHYAMNPDCRPDSAPSTVLLFETRGGWNQHGGPKLFTFDNHDPKGGLVLLNDGTVKFIRTQEELKQLRWK